ncbi:hypothetical protein BO94DRAFT_531773 [Aspergillus sclerotioniger CBS 115572]|uniref:Uncharacterized protein n=1 Tax=Aspergillus sclerotioniger CBS 115572 TaxID=1450535 RepID=A0A317XB10_9EURO|nr:hypothetical protein BO94DRAFT_531773 [Aspergillus sclerotioniger CBS 115572]PWY94832.1 hypothetical protein BO94DRAFT_531773 [Aspergillus sclerotioniger CBS 115572]
MSCLNNEWVDPKDLRILFLAILYVVASIICILVLLVQRLHRRAYRSYAYAPLERQMMDPPPSYLSEKRGHGGIGSGGEEEPVGSNAAVGQGQGQVHGYGVAYLKDPASHSVGPFPSACDILHPLSHSSPLPSSGYLAAVLARERINWTKQSYPPEDHLVPSSLGRAASAPGQDRHPAAPTAAMDDRLGDPSFEEGLAHGAIVVSDPPRQTGSLAPAQWHARSHEQGVPSIANLIGPQPSQKCGYAVQFLHDEDEEGERSWRRLMIEYS